MKEKKSWAGGFIKLAALAFAALMIVSGYRVWKIAGDYRAEAEMRGAVMDYRPKDDEPVNRSVIDLQAKYPDIAGWLTVPGTKIDYPFVWHEDNDHYLRRDLNGDYALAGTLFLDSRCSPDFSARNTIIYGHHMKNGSMFGTLKAFADKDFFDANTSGTIYLPRQTLALEFFAYMIVKSTDQRIYGELDLGYVEQNARQYRDVGPEGAGRVVVLSSCSYEFNDARMVLIARVK